MEDKTSDAPSPDKNQLTHSSRYRTLRVSIRRIAALLGILTAAFGIFKTYEEIQSSLKISKLNSLSNVNKLIDDDIAIRIKIRDFKGKLQHLPPVTDLLKEEKTGENLYSSPRLSDFHEIGRHYERIGALVRLGYLDFDLLFEIIPFPDDFWHETESLRNALRNHWGTAPLPDLLSNFEYLCDLYQERRHKIDPQRLIQRCNSKE